MNERIGPSPIDVLIDRLVDGELTKQQYRSLLAQLEKDPGGWRRCALAFLEAQALQQDLAEICGAAQARPQVASEPPLDAPARRTIPFALACALSLLLAFGLGWSLPRGGPNNARPRILAPSSGDMATASDTLPRPEQAVAQPGQEVLVEVGSGGSNPETLLPLVPLDDQYAAWLLDAAGPVPPDIERALERLGYEVHRQRQWAPLESAGRQVFVPMEQVEIRPVSGPSYY